MRKKQPHHQRSLLCLETTRSTGGGERDEGEPPSPSPRTTGGKGDPNPMWTSTEIQNAGEAPPSATAAGTGNAGSGSSKPTPYNIKGTLERRRRIMSSSGSKSSFKVHYLIFLPLSLWPLLKYNLLLERCKLLRLFPN